MGASLLAMGPGQSTSILTDTPPSRASSLPQWICGRTRASREQAPSPQVLGRPVLGTHATAPGFCSSPSTGCTPQPAGSGR
ncbi:hypothetical protein CEQ51_20420 [Pseudomonas thivervalensis]|uniref:Uncharacterized protein n=1 Tax=Pseudomonas thivervalensis TaxID=86265 RepID=A0A2Z4ZFY4_9PSED|nr:hypothetical protein CE140_19870 [Pseudomonas thivervalensis]AXA62339.1 hypothetical protein CEQ51_20420 [Pseudomonas thivervalensis]